MKVLLLNLSDIQGGAARAAYRLHQGLKGIGVKSQMLVQDKISDDPAVIAPRTKLAQGIAKTRVSWGSLPLKIYPQRKGTFSSQWLPDSILPQVTKLSPDLINLHWINGSYLQLETLAKFKQPIVWTLHDMWAFTGGCHYSGDCNRYTQSCGACPKLSSNREQDLSRWVWWRKNNAWRNTPLTIVALSSWMAECIHSSSLLRNARVELIPNGIDTNKFQPIEKRLARQLLNLPQNKQIILFGALGATSDNRKGFHLLQPALQQLSQSGWHTKAELAVFGASTPSEPPDFGLPVHYLGILRDDLTLALAYAAADVFVLPSLEDNLPNTVMEANACGTPCVAFNIGGVPDLIEHQQNGYLAQPYQVTDLAQGVAWVLSSQERQQKLSSRAREKVKQEFTLEIQANRYSRLFSEVLSENHLSGCP